MRICVVIPMHNEEAIAERSLATILPYIEALAEPATVFVVNDGSRDGTEAIVERVRAARTDDRLVLASHPVNQGYGAALRTGMRYAIDGGYDYALFMDSDLTNHPRYLTLFVERMREGWDLIKASRYHSEGSVIGVPIHHQRISRIGNAVARVLYGLPIRDCTNGFRAVRCDLLRNMHLTESGFAIILEELAEAKRLGARCCEIPYTLTSRGHKDGRSHLTYNWKTCRTYLTHALRARGTCATPPMADTAVKTERKMGMYTAHTTCRFCGGSSLTKMLDFGPVPLAGGFLKPEHVADEEYYPLDLKFCNDCTLVQVANAVSGETLFRKHYFYYSSKIQTLVDHCAAFAQDVYDRFLKDKPNAAVFEIGCNDGVMLRPFAKLGVRAMGMDPASNVVASVAQEGFTIIDDFFNHETAARVREQHGQFDAITTSYSFAHIDDMRSVMDGVDAILKSNGVLVFEVYYLGTLIDEMQYDMIYHEHCSYYSLSAMRNFLARYGMEVFDVYFTPGVRSGAARFYARRIGQRSEPISESVRKMEAYEIEHGFAHAETFNAYGDRVAKTRTDLLALLNQLKSEGKTIIGYGASGRGTTIMNYCGIDGRYLDYVVDDAPAKHGFLTPGTHVPIYPWAKTEEGTRPDYALLFAWSFMKEVVQKRADYLRAGGKFIVPLPEVRIVGAEVLR